MDLSFKEKSTWISLITTLGIFTYYFYNMVLLKNIPVETAQSMAIILLIKAVVMTVIVEATLQGILAMSNHKAAMLGADEREQLFSYKANGLGYKVLVVGVMFTLAHLLLAELKPAWSMHDSMLTIPLLSAHILMLAFILSEIVRFTSQLFYYRSEH